MGLTNGVYHHKMPHWHANSGDGFSRPVFACKPLGFEIFGRLATIPL